MSSYSYDSYGKVVSVCFISLGAALSTYGCYMSGEVGRHEYEVSHSELYGDVSLETTSNHGGGRATLVHSSLSEPVFDPF